VSARNWREDASLRPQPRRDGPDYWPTPDCLICAFVKHVLPTLPSGVIWECAAGDGRLAAALRVTGREVIATDLYQGKRPLDFLHDDAPLPRRFGAIVTNPPSNELDRFIRRGLHLMDRRITQALALLLRYDALMASGRVDVLNRAMLIVSCHWRARWIPNSVGQPRWSYVWALWLADYAGPPTTSWVQRR
jgi:hypothetical protein